MATKTDERQRQRVPTPPTTRRQEEEFADEQEQGDRAETAALRSARHAVLYNGPRTPWTTSRVRSADD